MEAPDDAEIIAALKESQFRLRAVLDSTADAIVIIDASGKIIEVNPATLRLFGYGVDELVGQNVNIFMPSPHRENHHHYIERYLETGEARVIGIGREVRGLRKDGSTFPLELAVNPIDHLGMFCGIMRDISDRHALERQVIHAVMEERRRSARDLHDGLGSLLTAIHLRVDSLAKSLAQADTEPASEAFAIRDLVKRALGQTRAIAKGLEPVGQEPDDLMDGLKEFARQVDQSSPFGCEFQCPEPVLIHDYFLSRHLYRIAQEATNNAIKHSGGTRVVISLLRHANQLELSVADDGKGLESPYRSRTGSGLQIMRYRANAIGGTLTFVPPAAGGCHVLCSVPLPGRDGGAGAPDGE